MSKSHTFLKVLFLHGLVLAIGMLIPMLRGCKLFPKEEEVITIDLSGMEFPAPEPEVAEVAEPEPEEEEAIVIPEATPPPAPTPTPLPEPPPPEPAPTATPRPAPTPTPRPPLLTPEQIRARIENQPPTPPRQDPPPTMSPQEIRDMIARDLPSGGGGGSTGGAATGGTSSLAGVQAELSRRLDSAWDQPRHLGGISGLKVIASVDVQRDGNIRNTRILSRSGNAEYDRSVQDALSSVRFAKPLPSSYSGSQHSFEVEFILTP